MAIHLVSDNTSKQNPSVSVPRQDLDFNPDEIQQTLRLAGLLQTSLEVESILEYFLESARMTVDFDGARYNYEPLSVSYQFGKNRAHSCTYSLSISEEVLGQIEFSRSKRFTDDEIGQLEKLLTQLIYPLRNSIWYQRALQASQRDALTGAYNRASFDSTFRREVELAHRNEMVLSLLVVDVDHFKSINDNYGHSAGDAILKCVVTLVKSILRKSDLVYRYGGEEFTVILSGTPAEGAKHVAERIRHAIESHVFHHEQSDINVTASIGVSTLRPYDDTNIMFDRADKALYMAKQQGRNRIFS